MSESSATAAATDPATATDATTATDPAAGIPIVGRDALVRLFYGLSRSGSASQTARLLSDFRSLVKTLFFSPRPRGAPPDDWNRGALLATVLQTRDLAGGKGEYGLFYLLMGELFMCDHASRSPRAPTAPAADAVDGDPVSLAVVLVRMMASLVTPESATGENAEDIIDAAAPVARSPRRPGRPYGCWKDFRSVLSHLREMVGEEVLARTEFFDGCISHMVAQLQIDHAALEGNPDAPITLFAKWAPRETSQKHGWLAKYIAQDLVHDDGETEGAGSRPSQLARYRRWVSALNRRLKTPAIAQCEGRWRDIDFNRDVPAGTLRRQRRAFQYPSWSDTAPLTPRTQDRGECRRNYLEYLRDCAQGTSAMKAGNLSPRALVRDAIAVAESDGYTAREAAVAASAINLQWWEGRAQVPSDARIHPHPIIPIIITIIPINPISRSTPFPALWSVPEIL